MKIGANIPSLTAYANMDAAYRRFSKSSQRLSSGIRLNSASDDPAALSVSDKMRLHVNGLRQASRNASDAVALTETADGALSQISDALQRIRELSVSAASDAKDSSDRQKIQYEIDSLVQEIDMTPLRAEYNGIKIINGECDRIIDKTGVEPLLVSDETPYGAFSFMIDKKASPAMISFTGGLTSDPLPGLANKGFFVNDKKINITAGETKQSLIAKIRALGEVVATEGAGFDILSEVSSEDVGSDSTISVYGDASVLTALGLHAETAQGEDAEISDILGVLQNAAVVTTGNAVTITAANGAEILAEITGAAGDAAYARAERGPLVIQVGADKDTGMYMSIPRVNAKTARIDRANALNIENASTTILSADNAIAVVSEIRARIGSYQNRLERSVNNLDNAYVNAAYSMSRIKDTDMPAEMAEYAKNSVIYQAGIAMLSQSNARAQAELQLLR
ncbi:MAG: flagellin [Clostridiales bacterium]|jgi:flagellin|nr:flagellin [Clostridiales bacterium]